MCEADIAACHYDADYLSDLREKYGDAPHRTLYSVTFKPKIEGYFRSITIPTSEQEQREAGNRKDVRNNFLYEEWKRQLRSKDAIDTYPVFALYTTIKAAVLLLSERKSAPELDLVWTPELRDQVIRWKESADWNPNSPSVTIGHGALIPGLLAFAECLMMRYSDFVRAERDRLDSTPKDVIDSPLPDDPFDESLPERYEIPFDIRVENAVQGFLAKEGAADVVSQRYKIPQKYFRTVLKERGLMPSRGGDRKGSRE
jgi:hypothetical protein